ncbi:MAG: CorA family divalent cation transporter [Methanoregula sp.]|nr:CorA family divalent cation transporter [Methanoregula sp.]
MSIPPENNEPATDPSDQHRHHGSLNTSIRITPWQDWEEIGRKERAGQLRQTVNDVFCEQVMGTLALLLIPILLLSDFAGLPAAFLSFLSILDVAIWLFFILEYVCRLIVAEDRWKHFTSPWNILDLIIVGVPAAALVLGAGYGIARYFRVLRVMQAAQILFVGGRTASRHFTRKTSGPDDEGPGTGMRIRSLPLAAPSKAAGTTAAVPAWQPVTISSTATSLDRSGQWLDFSELTRADFSTLSRISSVPAYVLDVKLREHAYTRAEISGKLTTVFVKIPRLVREPGTGSTWQFSWDGVLVAYDQESVMTFAHTTLPLLDTVALTAGAEEIPLTGPGIIYLIVRDEMGTIENLILAAEEQLVYLEAQPMNRLPSNFLTMMYTDQKALSRITSGLLHTKTALEEICDNIQNVTGKETPEEGRLRSLIDRCSLLSDNAQHVSDSFAWMVDFYLNTTSFSMNRVMKILAVLTALTMVPAIVGGLLGMNLIGNPWPATLLQMVTIVGLVMVLTAWVYFNLGWLKRD